ncbi:MAG: hypothetical protein IJG02_07340 [Thermoguttaceae bacterium]|nr:hypothetical protein [Thermoguttaceae bacterium]
MDTFLDNLRSLIIAVAAAAVCYVLFLLVFGDKKPARESDTPIFSGDTAVAVAEPQETDALPSIEDEALAVVRQTFGGVDTDAADDTGVTEDIAAADTAVLDDSRRSRDLSYALGGTDEIAQKADAAYYQAATLPGDSGFRFDQTSFEKDQTETLADTGASAPLTEITLPFEMTGADAAADAAAETAVDTLVEPIADTAETAADTVAEAAAESDDFFAGEIDAADNKADELFASALGAGAPADIAVIDTVPAAESAAAESAANDIEDDNFFVDIAETDEAPAAKSEAAETNNTPAPADVIDIDIAESSITEAPAAKNETAENTVAETPAAETPADELVLLDIGNDFFSDMAEATDLPEAADQAGTAEQANTAEVIDIAENTVGTVTESTAGSTEAAAPAETDDFFVEETEVAENNHSQADTADAPAAENNIAGNIDVQAPAIDIAAAEADAYHIAETEPSVAAEVADIAQAATPQPSAAHSWVTPRDLSGNNNPSGRSPSAAPARTEAARSLAVSAPSSKIPLTPWLEAGEKTAAETTPLIRAPQNTAEELPVSQEIIDSFESVAQAPVEARFENTSLSRDASADAGQSDVGPEAAEQTAQAEPAPAAEEQTAQAEPAPAAEEQTAQAEPAPAAEEQTAQAEPAPAAEEQTAQAEPAPSAEQPAPETSTAELSTESSAIASDNQQAAGPVLENDIWYIDASQADYRPETLTFYRYDQTNPVASSLDEFISTSSPERPVFILVHGNLTDAAKAVQHGMSVRGHLQQIQCANCQASRFRLVIWKWPSEKTYQGILPDSQYKANLADQCGFALAGFLGALPPGPPVTLIGFSFGARTVGSAMTLLAGGAIQGQVIPAGAIRQGSSLFNVFLLAAASDCGDYSLQGKYGPGLSRVINIVNAYNPSDKALSFYTFLYPGYPTQAQGTAPILTPSPNLTNHTWSVNTSMYGPEHRFENYLAALGPGLGVTLSMAEKTKPQHASAN